MSEHICRNCRWWSGPRRDEWACCDLAESADLEPLIPHTKAMGAAGEQDLAGLVTRYDFGCVQWEGKE